MPTGSMWKMYLERLTMGDVSYKTKAKTALVDTGTNALILANSDYNTWKALTLSQASGDCVM